VERARGVTVDRHDDELAERRASGGRPKAGTEPERAAPTPAPKGGGALPLQWADAGSGPEPEAEEGSGLGETIDLAKRAERSGRDDLDVWSDVLRRRPMEAARLTGHPSAAGERLQAAAARFRGAMSERAGGEGDSPAGVPERRRRRRRGSRPAGKGAEDDAERQRDAPANVSRLRPMFPEQEGQGGPKGFGAELATRVVTGVVVAAACLLTFNAGQGPAAGLCAVIIGLAVLELCTALRKEGYRPAVPIALVGSVALVVGTYHAGLSVYPGILVPVVVSAFLWHLAQVVRGRPVTGIAMTLLPVGYVGILGGFAGEILRLEHGIGLLVGLAICTVSYDVFGYLAGSRLGRRRIAPSISPNKTVEGLLAGMAGSVVMAVVVAGSITPWGRLSALTLGSVVAVLAPLGDLCESMLKRDLGVKDLGGLLPGHGGVLDRFDTILFALPGVYYLIRLLGVA
jgi:CDP-diglyceride synthetase